MDSFLDSDDFILNDQGMVIAMEGLVPPRPWEVRKSSKFAGINFENKNIIQFKSV